MNAIVVFALSFLAVFASSFFYFRPVVPPPRQPIAFNHQAHVQEAGLDCTDCHKLVREHRSATLPGPEVCLDCHSEGAPPGSEEAKVHELASQDGGIRWIRVSRFEQSNIHFSHRQHVVTGEISCATCHGEMSELTEPLVARPVDLDMGFCVDCHRKTDTSTDCLVCHR